MNHGIYIGECSFEVVTVFSMFCWRN